jgi:hypothetical protein
MRKGYHQRPHMRHSNKGKKFEAGRGSNKAVKSIQFFGINKKYTDAIINKFISDGVSIADIANYFDVDSKKIRRYVETEKGKTATGWFLWYIEANEYLNTAVAQDIKQLIKPLEKDGIKYFKASKAMRLSDADDYDLERFGAPMDIKAHPRVLLFDATSG